MLVNKLIFLCVFLCVLYIQVFHFHFRTHFAISRYSNELENRIILYFVSGCRFAIKVNAFITMYVHYKHSFYFNLKAKGNTCCHLAKIQNHFTHH